MNTFASTSALSRHEDNARMLTTAQKKEQQRALLLLLYAIPKFGRGGDSPRHQAAVMSTPLP